MTDQEWELAHLMVFIEDNIIEARDMLKKMSRERYWSEQNARTFSRLRSAAVDLTTLYLLASCYASEARSRAAHPSNGGDECL